jgi:hypothetical protein
LQGKKEKKEIRAAVEGLALLYLAQLFPSFPYFLASLHRRFALNLVPARK